MTCMFIKDDMCLFLGLHDRPFSLADWREQDHKAALLADCQLGVQFAFSLESLFEYAEKNCQSNEIIIEEM